jgi:hypothetical protein
MPTKKVLSPIWGRAYVSVEDFRAAAWSVGAQAAIVGIEDDPLLTLLAMASRSVDGFCGRSFGPEEHTENHPLDVRTRRIVVNNPPVEEIVEIKIQVGPGNGLQGTGGPYATFNTTDVMVNQQEGYLEIDSLAWATGLTGTLITFGITDPQVIITYTSYQSVPQGVMAATALIAAQAANQSKLALQMNTGLTSVKDGEQSWTKAAGGTDLDVPERAARLLTPFIRYIAG